MSLERHYKTAVAAEILGMSPATLRSAALRGEVCPIRIGTDLYWPESVVEEWLARNRVDNSRVVPLHRASTTRRSA